MGIGDRLRELREQKHLNQEAFGALGGVSIKTQNRYEMGGRKPTFDYLEALAAAGVDVVYLLTGETDPQKLPPDEQELIRAWRQLSADNQAKFRETIKLWAQRDTGRGAGARSRLPKGEKPKQFKPISDNDKH